MITKIKKKIKILGCLRRHLNVCVKVVKKAQVMPDQEASSKEVTVAQIQGCAVAGYHGDIPNTQVAAQWKIFMLKYFSVNIPRSLTLQVLLGVPC